MTPINLVDLDNAADLLATLDDIELGTNDFIGPAARFEQIPPLVMLNACQTADAGDELRVYYNLPQQ